MNKKPGLGCSVQSSRPFEEKCTQSNDFNNGLQLVLKADEDICFINQNSIVQSDAS